VDGDDCDLCQRRGRGATEHRGQNVGAIKVMGRRENGQRTDQSEDPAGGCFAFA
jgi:hypothetical protein